jgi:hypothetical protein
MPLVVFICRNTGQPHAVNPNYVIGVTPEQGFARIHCSITDSGWLDVDASVEDVVAQLNATDKPNPLPRVVMVNPVEMFFEDCIAWGTGLEVSLPDLLVAYNQWAEVHNEVQLTRPQLFLRTQRHIKGQHAGWIWRHKTDGTATKYFLGIGLEAPNQEATQ